jgi:hypothetical protein
MICVVVLQNGMDVVQSETGSFSDACVTRDVGGTGDVSIKVEDSLDIKHEIPEPISFPPVKNEDEVRLQGVCEVVAAHADITLNYFLLSVILWVPCTFWNLDCKPEKKRLCGSHSH